MKKIKFYIFFLQYLKFSSRFMLFPTLKKNWCPKKIGGGGGGGGVDFLFFFRKTILSHFTFYAIFNIKKYWKVPLHLLVKWKVVSPNSREGHLESPLFPCSDFVSQMWGWLGGGGGVIFFSHFMLFPKWEVLLHLLVKWGGGFSKS